MSSHCQRFVQNAWKKDLCSNCFKSKEEHAAVLQTVKALPKVVQKTNVEPPKSIIKLNLGGKKHKRKVCFPKELSSVIGYGGEWSDSEASDDENGSEVMEAQEVVYEDDEELQRLTKNNTEFNMNNGNLLGDPTTNIKKSFAALKLGAPQKGSDGKKQTLKISVTPFGSSSSNSNSSSTTKVDFKPKITHTEVKKYEKASPANAKATSSNGIVLKSIVKTDSLEDVLAKEDSDKSSDSDVKFSSEKSLLEEISETLQKNNSLSNKILVKAEEPKKVDQSKNDVIKVEIKNPTVIASAVISSAIEKPSEQKEITNAYDTPKPIVISSIKTSSTSNITSVTTNSTTTATVTASNSMKRTIMRNCPIKKDQNKPKIQVTAKNSNTSESDFGSDQENLLSDYYDVVETRNSYENIPDGGDLKKVETNSVEKKLENVVANSKDEKKEESLIKTKSHFFSNQLISDMFMSHKKVTEQIKKRAESYNLSDGSYSKITADGLIVTKNNSHEDALDSTGSSFDSSSSSDEEMSSVNKSESDSGIGIRVTNGSYPGNVKSNSEKNSASAINSNNSSDYEDIQVSTESCLTQKTLNSVNVVKSRELEGEPDGRSDPDGSSEVNAPALPSSPPPAHDPRPSFLHNGPKPYVPVNQDKPKVPAKPVTVNILKPFGQKRTPAQSEVIMQLQQVITNPKGNDSMEKSSSLDNLDLVKPAKKTRAPNPPDEKENDNVIHEDKSKNFKEIIQTTNNVMLTNAKHKNNTVSQVKERHYPAINPKFRSLNNHHKEQKEEIPKPTTPEPAPRHSLSLSQDSLNMETCDKKKKNKFSIKKFLRMGHSSKSDVSKYADIPTYNDSPNSSDTPQVKPRLVIIHPLDINQSGVQVVKDCRSADVTPVITPTITAESPKSLFPNVVGKPPPAPPQRADTTKLQNSKPTRPPPPKSAELRRKQEEVASKSPTLAAKTNSDSVYANLGEVRSMIAPKKPERTASMREREARLQEMQQRRRVAPIGNISNALDNIDSSFSSSSKDDSFSSTSTENSNDKVSMSGGVDNSMKDNAVEEEIVKKEDIPKAQSATSTENFNERKKKIMEMEGISGANKLSSKIEIFENNAKKQESNRSMSSGTKHSTYYLNSDNLKNSVQKMNNTIDNYLKNKKLSVSDTNLLYDNGSTESSASSSPSPPIGNNGVANVAAALYGTNSRNYIRNNSNNVSNIELRTTPGSVANPSSASFETITIAGTSSTITMMSPQKYQAPIYQRSSYPTENSGSIFNDLGVSSPSPPGGALYRTLRQQSDFGVYASPVPTQSSSFANLPRATTQMSYCGSEMGESEIYSPYSFCGSEAGADVAQGDPNDGFPSTTRSKTVNRLRMRKGRSVVHKNLEDNYGAVIVANHEALAQVLEQLQQSPPIPASLRPIANCINLRFDDFIIIDNAVGVVVGRRVFHTALWNNAVYVTLVLTSDCNHMMSGGISGTLVPVTEFNDLVPSNYLPLMPSTQTRMVQTNISVLPRMHVDTLESLGGIMKSKTQNQSLFGSMINLAKSNGPGSTIKETIEDDEVSVNNEKMEAKGTINQQGLFDDLLCREVGFIMLQFVNGLKNMQAKGIEEMPLSLANVIMCKETDNKDAQARLCVLQGINQDLARDEDEEMGTLCQCAHKALTEFLPETKLTPILSHLLLQERSDTLTKAKSVLEYVLWGPSDISISGPVKEREVTLQRWLDLERATVLHGLVRTKIELTVYDECHLMFLVRSNSKIMCDASQIIANFNLNNV